MSSSSSPRERAARGAGGRRAEVGLDGLRLDVPSLPPLVGVDDAAASVAAPGGDVTRSLGRLAARLGDGLVRLVLSPPLVAREVGDATEAAGLGVRTNSAAASGAGEGLVPPRDGARRPLGLGCGETCFWSSSSSSVPSSESSLSSSSEDDGRAVERLVLRGLLLAAPPVSYWPAGRLRLRAALLALLEGGGWYCLRVTRARSISSFSSSSDSSSLESYVRECGEKGEARKNR